MATIPVVDNMQELLDLIKNKVIENIDTPKSETVQDDSYSQTGKMDALKENYYFLSTLMNKGKKRGQVEQSLMCNTTLYSPTSWSGDVGYESGEAVVPTTPLPVVPPFDGNTGNE